MEPDDHGLKILKLYDKITSLGGLSQKKKSLICPVSGIHIYRNTAKHVGTGLLIPALERQMQVDLNEFKASQSWIVRSYQEKINKQTKNPTKTKKQIQKH